jgi:ABC-2 type transport system permease protein
MYTVYKYTLRQLLRQRYLIWMLALLVVLFSIVSWNGARVHLARSHAHTQVTQGMRQAWLGQGSQNPHSSAHYGHYVFQPVSGMQVLDQGIRPFAGGLLRLEAHKQNEPMFSPAQQRTEMSRFGDFSMAWVLQVLLPLFIILAGFGLVSTDSEQQTLRLIAAQGIPAFRYLAGKTAAVVTLGVFATVTGVLIQYIFYYVMGANSALPTGWLASWLAGYALYAVLLSALSVAVSAASDDSRSSLTIQLAAWALWMIVMPRLIANMANNLFPLEHRQQFNMALAADRKKGIDGHNPADEHIAAFEDSLLKHYQVKTREELPINADGLVMLADEEYSNMVYDKHFARIRQTLDEQNRVSSLAAFTNPFLGIRNMSMGLAQSDYRHQLQLLQDAEAYRRMLMKNLNEKMAYGGSKTGDWDWTVDSTYWRTIPDFRYQQPGLATTLGWYKLEGLALAAWLLMVFGWLGWLAKRLYRFA